MTIYLIGEINAQSTEKFLTTPLQSVTGGDTVLISSPGGSIDYMLTIFDAIKQAGMNTLATGIVQSAAAVLTQAGRLRLATPNTLFRFLAPEPDPKTEEIPDLRWYLHSLSANLVAQRIGAAIPEGYDLFDNQFINAKRALELNLIDQIVEA